MIDALLEVVTNPFGYSAIACVCMALIGLGMMVVGAARSDMPRIGSAALLLAGVTYGAANIAVFVVTIAVDAFAIFDRAYIGLVGFAAPALSILGMLVFARSYEHVNWVSGAGFAVWTVSVAFAHLWVIAAASTSV